MRNKYIESNPATLTEDDVVIVPTRKYVKDTIKEAIEEHAKSRDHPYATLENSGFIILSNDVDSDSEITAATSKAVKAAFDLANTANQSANNANDSANTRLSKDQNGADIPNKGEFLKNLGLSNIDGYVGRLINVQKFTTSGNHHYHATPGTKKILITVIGAGGGGGADNGPEHVSGGSGGFGVAGQEGQPGGRGGDGIVIIEEYA
ncbi:tail fiber protein [Xenorhabdus indica]|uniref:tail fiber protein n=1 Tax=Xenorhabdus indica TaxID=333964 RepID=UPI001CA444BA|nr:tail fiber protein [Xenorhabdus indica]MBC8943779.1 tail protein [Xenorhabdus indica]